MHTMCCFLYTIIPMVLLRCFFVFIVLYFFFFFFKQKTAYEMRISDWSSDVCSSDLGAPDLRPPPRARATGRSAGRVDRARARAAVLHRLHGQIGRASCRERGVSTCRSRWSPYH